MSTKYGITDLLPLLRQVEKKAKETALIWLNEDNAKTLNKELDKQQHTSIEELNRGGSTKLHTLQRFFSYEKTACTAY